MENIQNNVENKIISRKEIKSYDKMKYGGALIVANILELKTKYKIKYNSNERKDDCSEILWLYIIDLKCYGNLNTNINMMSKNNKNDTGPGQAGDRNRNHRVT